MFELLCDRIPWREFCPSVCGVWTIIGGSLVNMINIVMSALLVSLHLPSYLLLSEQYLSSQPAGSDASRGSSYVDLFVMWSTK